MESQLHTLSKIFTERLFRIPDYQRGYAWTLPQLEDFWNDISQISAGENHYTGVLTLEAVPQDELSKWEDDGWIIHSKSYAPYYVVDGQQRLTTAIILIQCISEHVGDTATINFSTVPEIRKKYIFDSKDGGISRSYIFGYDKDNPSYEFLKTKIFCEHSSTSKSEETSYTNNLEQAKRFFAEKLTSMQQEDIELLFKKLTQSLLFNIFSISDEVDVCVAFETMNNRGKPLSDLELLKNRLIYLSLKFPDDAFERRKLRTTINDCWKEIYHCLGRNKQRPLNDDSFLATHYLLYYFNFPQAGEDPNSPEYRRATYESRRVARDSGIYRSLLRVQFVQARLASSLPDSERLTINKVYDYVNSLQKAAQSWYYIFNPLSTSQGDLVSVWLDKLDRLEGRTHWPMVLATVLSDESSDEKLRVLKSLERHQFIMGLYSQYLYVEIESSDFLQEAIDVYRGKLSLSQAASKIAELTKHITEHSDFWKDVRANYRSRGFYGWRLIRYFLYEYNLDLQNRSRTSRPKIDWAEFTERRPDYRSVEHIYPQNARASYWTERFSGLTPKQRESLRNSLGNLLPLSHQKNSSLSNLPFPEKVDRINQEPSGYRYGSYAENEVAKLTEWTPKNIRDRGLKMLAFMEKRWSIQLGSAEDKLEMLGLDNIPGLNQSD